MRSAACLLTLFVFAGVSSSAQTAKEILKNYFNAIGGIENLRNFTSASHKSTYIRYYPKRDTSVVTIIAKAPYSFNFKTFSKGELVYESYGNPAGQTLYFYKPYPDKRERAKNNVSLSTSHDLLLAYDKNKVQRLADTTINQSSVFAVHSTLSKKDFPVNRTYYFDKSNQRLIGFSSDGLTGDFNFLENYASVNNILIALKSKYILQQLLVNEFSIDNFEVNPALNDSLFIPREYVAPAKFKLHLNNKVEFLDPVKADLAFEEFIKEFSGKVVLIDLWASWCGPCKFEFSKYNDTYFHFLKSKNIETVYISLDKPEKEADWKKSIDQFTLHGHHVRANKKLYQSLQKKFFDGDAMYIPRLILIDKDGTVLSPELPKLSSGMFYTKVDELVR